MNRSSMTGLGGVTLLVLMVLGAGGTALAQDPAAASPPPPDPAAAAAASPAATQAPGTAAPASNRPVFNFGLFAGLATMGISNSHFGRGLLWPLPTEQIPLDSYKTDVARTEAFLAPRANMEWNLGNRGTLFGGLKVVTSRTVGDGDTWNLTAGNPSRTDLDTLYLGWRSPANSKSRIKWEATFGNQDFQLADGMVLVDGDNETSKSVYWIDPRRAWNNSAVFRATAAPWRLEAFYLNADGDVYTDGKGNPLGGNLGDEIQGANLEFGDPAKVGIVGASYFHVSRSDLPTRRGMNVSALHGRGRPIRMMPTLELAGEYDWQRNNARQVDANAWFAEATYTFLMPWYPTLGYRYSSFSGDRAGTAKNEAWDSLHNGFTPRGFGYWYQGIVVGTYETLLTNLNVNFIHLTLAPPMVPGSWLKALYYNHAFDEKSTAGMFPDINAPVSSNHFATEWDFVVGFSPTKKYDVMAIYGQATPGAGGVQRSEGFDKDESIVQFTVLVHF